MAGTATLPPQQHKQPSRKGKKAWRKNVDVSDVHEGLDEGREQIIKHGAIISEQPSDELFLTDVVGSKDIQKAYSRANKPLKADQILAQRSAIPALSSYKRAAEPVSHDHSAKRRRDYVSGKDYERLRKIAYGGEQVHKDVVQEGGDAAFDPWADEVPVRQAEFSFLEEKRPAREPRTLRQAPVSMAKNGKTISAVRKPERGKSYNPVFEDWQALVKREGDKATAEEQQRLDEEQREAEKRAMIEKAQAEEDRDQGESEWESEWEGIMSEREDATDEQKEWLTKKRPERKTPAERNKINRRKAEERLKVHQEKMRTREQDVDRVKAMVKETNKKRRERQQQQQATAFPDSDASSSEGDEFELRRGRLGKAALPDAPLEVVLADELEDSLRRLRPEGNLLQDRFRSIILRGKIESRAKITQPKRPKREVTEKWGYKDWKLK